MKPTTIASLQKCKQEKKRFATITAYDYSFAKLFAEEGLNVMLVGDSLGMTVQGMNLPFPLPLKISPTTLPQYVVARQTACCWLTCRLWRMPRRNKPLKTPQRLCVPVLTWSKLKAVSGWSKP